MRRRQRRPQYLNRTDHLLDMSPAGRNIFVSRDKQMESRAANRLKLWTRVVAVLVVVGITAAGGLVAYHYLAPWFREELTPGGTGSGAPSSSLPEASVPVYDSLGLPVYGQEVSLFVVNASHPVDRDYHPRLTEVSGVKVNACAANALQALVSAAQEDGLALVFIEGFVSYEDQEERFKSKVEELRKTEGLTAVMAQTEAETREPAPGESDFQSGMCLRLDGDPETFEDSKTYSWLKSNMGSYGFVFRYPKYKEDFTGMEPDPTVIRYVGGASALAMRQRSMCLEEYTDYLARQ